MLDQGLYWEVPSLKIRLKTIQASDLEDMRNLRNEDSIRFNHLYQKIISPSDQLKWWETLDKNKNIYLGLFSETALLGVLNLKDIDSSKGSAEAGAFIQKDYQGSGVIAVGSFCILDFAFSQLKLNHVYARVMKENQSALKYNLSLGFKIENENDEVYFITLNEKDFKESTKRISRIMPKLKE